VIRGRNHQAIALGGVSTLQMVRRGNLHGGGAVKLRDGGQALARFDTVDTRRRAQFGGHQIQPGGDLRAGSLWYADLKIPRRDAAQERGV